MSLKSLKRKETYPTEQSSKTFKTLKRFSIDNIDNIDNKHNDDEKMMQREYIQSYEKDQGFHNFENTPILDTLFTAGMEFEPNIANASYYNNYNYDDNLYDRKTVFQSGTGKSSVTIEENHINKMIKTEDIEDIDQEILDKSCGYNIELNIGVLGLVESARLSNFIENKDYFIPQIERELEEFKNGFYDKNKDNHIRRLYSNQKDIKDHGFRDCALLEELSFEEKESSSFYYIKAYDNPESVIVTPQVTLGISYAIYPILIRGTPKMITLTLSDSIFYKIKERNTRLYNENSYKVFEGFMYVIFNYSLTAAYFHHKDIVKRMEGQGIKVSKSKGFEYFKSLFPLKPRTNLAESYKYLIMEYEGFSQLFDKAYDNIIKEYNDYISKFGVDFIDYQFNPSDIRGYTDLVTFHINLLREVTSKDALFEDINKRLNRGDLSDESYIYQDIVSFIMNQEDHFINDLLKIVGLVNVIYLMYQIKNPRKVVRVRFLDRSKVGDDCKILDGYFFSYEEKHSSTIDRLEKKGLIEIMDNRVYDFAHTSDPVILTLVKGKICTEGKRREEIFELIPTNSNLVVEFRNPSVVAGYVDSYSKITPIPFSYIVPFLKDFFKGLYKILAEELIECKISSEKEFSRSYCTLMFKPKN